jgi:hypothetical protein
VSGLGRPQLELVVEVSSLGVRQAQAADLHTAALDPGDADMAGAHDVAAGSVVVGIDADPHLEGAAKRILVAAYEAATARR